MHNKPVIPALVHLPDLWHAELGGLELVGQEVVGGEGEPRGQQLATTTILLLLSQLLVLMVETGLVQAQPGGGDVMGSGRGRPLKHLCPILRPVDQVVPVEALVVESSSSSWRHGRGPPLVVFPGHAVRVESTFGLERGKVVKTLADFEVVNLRACD